jgi:hypothetical protein
VKYQAYMSLVFDLDMGRRNPWEEEERWSKWKVGGQWALDILPDLGTQSSSGKNPYYGYLRSLADSYLMLLLPVDCIIIYLLSYLLIFILVSIVLP